ncbi:CA216 protein, partial [Grus americana]|nr:CA216 protein [Grus americana]
MFAVCPPGAPANAPFRQGRGGLALGTAHPGAGCGQDSNSNFVGEVCDSNENWSRPAPGSPPEEGSSQNENTTNPSDNLLLLMQRQMVQGQLRDAAPSPGATRPRLPEPGVRSPPEGAPDSTCGSTWDPPTAAPLPRSPPQPGVAEPELGTLFPALAEAVQHLQDKERFKEREKEKHHIQLVMYRRLALLRWIHGLQQKVVDQQNRLQESFDTILDNRKELIRCMQHGPVCPAGAAASSP